MSRRGAEPDDDEFVGDEIDSETDAEIDSETDGEIDSETDSEIDSETAVSCPYCGETTVISLDYGSGAVQEYVEDCEVCCRPWRVRVRYDRSGAADVTIDPV